MKLVVCEAEEREAAAFGQLSSDVNIVLTPETVTAENAEKWADTDIISTFINSRLDRDALEKLPSLKLIATRSTGYDHIDLGYCRMHGILVCNVPTYGENTVAEHVFALLLAISHRLPEAIERARSERFSPEGLQGFDLAGKTLGVIGTGHIGRHVIRIAKGFAMNVVAHDMEPDLELSRSLGFRYSQFDEVLALSDILSLHVPATKDTWNMLSDAAFAKMKDGVVVINTARGSLIDSRALITALVSGKVAAVGLDVLPEEPLIREEAELISSIYNDRIDLRDLVASHVLLRMPNVIVTPHSAFNTRESIGRIVETTIQNIVAFVNGKPQNVVAAT